MLVHYFLLTLLVASSCANPAKRNVDSMANNEIPREDSEYRLPSTVKPTHYDLMFDPNFVNFDFQGETIINITVEEEVTEIKIHAQDLIFIEKETALFDFNGTKVNSTISAKFFPITDFYILGFTPKIKAGKYQLCFKYSGILHDDGHGFYRSWYINEQDEKVWLATTQFEATSARRAFPCFDEPAMKATFKIKIRHFDNYTAISNMHAVLQTRPHNDINRWETEFAQTPPMSTYLVAFVVSDFKYLSSDDGKFRILAPSNQIKNGKYALEVGKKILNVLVDYMGSSHGVSKLDNIAIPQFGSNAMENWGLVTYKKSTLLFEENVTSSTTKQIIAGVIAHEFVHQWFGNLVSPSWWDYTWLKEGFARYFQYYMTDKVETTWRSMDQFVIKILQETAFLDDDQEDQHAMDTIVRNPLEIEENFVGISYGKSSSVIRMFSHMITESAFHTAVRQYLTTNKFKATKSDDLIKSLITAVPEDNIYKEVNMTSVFRRWIRTPGFPVITVKRNYTTKTATITQQRFLTYPTSPPTQLWIIPTNYATQDNPDFNKTTPTLWIPERHESIDIVKDLPENKWVIFNVQQTGYYRVNYDTENWKLIAEYMKDAKQKDKIHLLNRAQLLDDSYHFVEAGKLSDYSTFLEITEHLKNEVDYIPWYVARRAFTGIEKALGSTESMNLFKLYMIKLMEKLEKSLGYEERNTDNILDKMNRLDTIRWACGMGSKDCLASTHTQLVEHLEGSRNISTELRSIVLCSGVRSANATTLQKVYDFATGKKEVPADAAELVHLLSCSTNPEFIKKYLEIWLSTDRYNYWVTAASMVLFNSPYGNFISANLILDFIRTNLRTLIEMDPHLNGLSNILNEIAYRMTNKDEVTQFNEWIETLATVEEYQGLAVRLVNGALVTATAISDWASNHDPKILKFLESQKLIATEETIDK